jgi:cellulose synthase/poly-beta-1,6-N-acetylglucosamine synthase-like glycosyltransferase
MLAFITYLFYSCLIIITLYCVLQLPLLFSYLHFHIKKRKIAPSQALPENLPFVTIQLPVYNEVYVVERLIDCIAQFHYPKDRFEIHILDDSTDTTVDIVHRKVSEYRNAGFQIEQINRANRQGFKAGALKEAMAHAHGEFIAIFDADFLPSPDFLQKTLPHFQQENVGVVQTRWEHLNEDFSLLTRLQAMQLNVHFRVEQMGRSAGGHWLQFNGTAGVWRKKAIEDAGGWEADTLTEDLDLSIRAQLKGWKICYLEDFASLSELPSEMNGLKSQQFRWMKGGAETARKMLPKVMKSQAPVLDKLFAFIQLLGSSIFPVVFLLGLTSVPYFFQLTQSGDTAPWLSAGLVGLLVFTVIQFVSNVKTPENNGGFLIRILKFMVRLPLMLAMGMGISFHNTIAVLEGWSGRKTAFVRTPKYNIVKSKDTFRAHEYLAYQVPFSTYFEGFLALYYAAAVWFAVSVEDYRFFLLHVLLALGYGAVFGYTILHLGHK